MSRQRVAIGIILSAVLAGMPALAKAPTSKDVMKPVDTGPGTISDPNHLLVLNLDTNVSINVISQPALVVFNNLNARLRIEFGFAQGFDRETPLSLVASGRGRDVLKALGEAAKVRFEVVGPTQMRVIEARSAPLRKRPSDPPPAKHP